MDPAQYQRQLVQDRAHVASGLNVRIPDGRQVAALMRVLRDLVDVAKAQHSVTPLMAFFQDNIEKADKAFLSDIPVACHRGCAHCCRIWVDASPVEILYVAKSFSGAARDQATETFRDAVSVTGGMSSAERGKLVYPCPNLKDGVCSIYDVRPTVCRSLVSMDASVCARVFYLLSDEEIVSPAPNILLGRGYRLALAGALKHAGLAHTQVELNSSLDIAFSNPQAEQQWLEGEDPFAAADKAPEDDVMADENYRMIYETAFAGY
jgi:hypothetical protein